MTIWKKFFVFLILSCFLFAAVFSVSGCGGLASVVTTAASTSLGGMEAWVFVPAPAGRDMAKHTSKVSPPVGFVALPGATLTIVGTGQSAVTDSSGYASITGLANGTYTVTVAKEGYKTFTYTVTVATGEDTQVGGSSGIQTETSTAPGIMNLSATSGAIGDSVTITGVNFGSMQDVVQFNGVDVTEVTSWSSTSIVCKVPAGATTGNIVIKVGSEASNSVSFTVTGAGAPVIDSLSVSVGGEGAPVAIIGSGFGATQGTSTVTFNGKTVTRVSWSDTLISTEVPAGATTGNVVVTVNSVASNGVSFGVLSWHTVAAVTAQTLNDVTGTSGGTNVLAVGTSSTILAYKTSTGIWSSKKSGGDYAFTGVWGTSNGSMAYAVGGAGNVWTSNAGGAWTQMESELLGGLNKVWGSGASNVFFVGAGGKILRYDGAWNELASGTENMLNGIWGSSSTNIFAVGNSGVILRSANNGANWTTKTPVADRNILGVWGVADNAVFVVYQNDGRILASLNNFNTYTEWAPAVEGVTDQLNDIWGSSINDVFVVGNNSTILHYDGTRWSKMTVPFGTTQNLYGVWGSSSSDVYAVGDSGKILHYGTN